MVSALERMPRHVFLSYSRLDRKVAEKLASRLRDSDLRAWIDEEDLKPGTSNWESKIRKAVSESYAVVLVCSPNTAASPYIGAELKLAEKYQRQIVPIWVAGDDWVDCVPLGLVNYQYIDCRDDSYEIGFARLITQLFKTVSSLQLRIFIADNLEEFPTAFIPILVSRDDEEKLDLFRVGDSYRRDSAFLANLNVLAINPDKYTSFEEMLDDLYTCHLRSRYKLYTYGKDWVLAKVSEYVTLLAVPWMWLKHKQKKLLIDVIPDYTKRSTPVAEYGIGAPAGYAHNSVWAIVNTGFEEAYGLLTSNDHVAAEAFSGFTKGLEFTFDRCLNERYASEKNGELILGVRQLDNVDPEPFKYKLVVVPPRNFPFYESSRLFGEAVFIIP